MQLSEKITLLRKRRGLSQEQLANELDVSRQAIYKWESGQTTPEIEKVKRLSDIFNVSLSDLLNDNVDIAEAPIIITNTEEEAVLQEGEENEDEGKATQDTYVDTKKKRGTIILICLLCSAFLIAVALGIALIIALKEKNEPPVPNNPSPSHVCEFGAYKTEAEPSCSKAGLERRYCLECDQSESRPIPSIPHSEIITSGYEATCTKGGLTNGKKCANCDTVLLEQKPTAINANNHREETVFGYASTCTKNGLSDGKICADCDKVLLAQTVVEINPEAHTRIAVEGKAPTCLEKGLTDGVKCSECNKTLQGQTEIDTSEHTVEILKGYDATCLSEGLTEGKRCSYCKVIILKQQVILSNGQHIRKTVEGYASSCTVPGMSDSVICTECNTVLTEQKPLELAPHSEETTKGVEPTCTTVGYSDRTVCGVCQLVIKSGDLIPTKEHTYTDGKCTVCKNQEPNITENNAIYTLNDDELSYSISTFNFKDDDTLIIPSTYKGLPVTRIESVDETECKNIVIPNTVTHIGNGAFLFEGIIEHIEIPNSVKYIGTNAFEGCYSLKYLYIPNSVEYADAGILNTSASSNQSMAHITIYCQNGLSTEGWHENWDMFYTYSSSVEPTKQRHNVLFVDSESDIPKDDISEELLFILNDDRESYSVTGNTSVQSASKLTIPDTYKGLPVTQILGDAFLGNTIIEEVFIPSSVKYVGANAFKDCSSLKTVTICSGVETIMTCAFANTAIEKIFIPSSVLTMGPAVFEGCNSMKGIYCEHESAPFFDSEELIGWSAVWDIANDFDRHYCVYWGCSEIPTE